jgi:hypothetical protein
MKNLKFLILEQPDGRYIVVVPPFDTAMGWMARGETLVPWEQDVRSTNKCYSEISEYMVSSGMYLDYAAQIEYIKYPAQT